MKRIIAIIAFLLLTVPVLAAVTVGGLTYSLKSVSVASGLGSDFMRQ